jgi:uncharacterized protein
MTLPVIQRVLPPLLGAIDFNLEEPDAFLMSDRAPEDSTQLSDLDGFLAGIAIGPELIMPSEWVPGGSGPKYKRCCGAN